MRVPAILGGPGGSVTDYIEMIAAIGAADSNVAHALRSHFNYVENVVLSEPTERDAGAIELILAGKLFGGAHTEQGTARPGQVTTTIVRHGETYRLNGRKWYATGTAFADFASFSALDEQGQTVGVLLPVDRPGIQILDDWDGMGQRLTASGGVILDNVEVFPMNSHDVASTIWSAATAPPCASCIWRRALRVRCAMCSPTGSPTSVARRVRPRIARRRRRFRIRSCIR